MRNEEEMYALILGVAERDERIRAVWMNGSRTNPNVPKDIFQDYDVVYVVRENRPFYENQDWLDVFGERLYMQRPDEMDALLGKPCDFDRCYGWLMQLADGNRIDLHVVPVGDRSILDDKLCRILLDKDGSLPEIPPATDEDYRVGRPDAAQFFCCCNEFWWCLNNVAKGLWRGEIPYVHDMLYHYCQPQLIQLLNWQIGFATDFQVSTGKAGKYLQKFLPAETWRRFLATYAGAQPGELERGAREMCRLFDDTARALAAAQGFSYDEQEAEASFSYFEHVLALPKDATEIY